MATTKQPTQILETPKPVLKPGLIYSGDNGMRICIHCAGRSALYTGRDLSGRKVKACTKADAQWWKEQLDKDLACERGCTTFRLA